MFVPFRASMLWRLDLTNYADVKANASLIYTQISTQQMPPTPYDTFSSTQVELFQSWIAKGCQP
ncbi:hypothetical protein [Acidicapsa acidisoli]|uniref:hypothetical protein n=1 Tax=Acidicapsa acidisoli TaxID=1615681 RepID=UPI0021DFB204|nr:hypothetical protein [Acidicapsa acidisoli]